ncbi:FapA family protein [Photobacterium sp. SDRW27]|uniref:DUF342 domain-containing protein n=1 Tax=Photobacterium obscurum TaxID=2829490 RepID=UPI0022443634|nr:FapA family protein [Photobacterium obscurum]MCW8329014.1 FapA family protein [Photobacterium obscurum]
MPQQLLQLSPDGQTVCLFVTSDHEKLETPDTQFSRSDIARQLAEVGASSFYLFENAIDSALERLNSPSINADNEPEPQQIVIAERRDASLMIKTEADLMKASITVVGAYGGTPIKGPMLINALKENNIVKGIRKTQLQALLAKSRQLPPGHKLTLPVAFGRLPSHGTDTVFKPLVEDACHRILRPQSLEDGKVDMRDLGEIITVKPGQPIMKRIPATPGIAGFNVLGKEMEAIPGKEHDYIPGEGTEISESDDQLLVATKAGMPVRKEYGMQIDDALTLQGVNVATGHINFDGSVLITGDVTPGMKVSASGNITVTGFVELGTLKAGGDIAVIKGIIGRQQEGKHLGCYLQAGGKVTSKFAQFVEIDAGEDVSFSLHALHCIIRAQGEVSVIDEAKRHGTLSGGYVEAGYSVSALNIGALAGVPTEIVAFSKYSDIRDQLHTAYHAAEHEQEQLGKIKEAQLKLLQIPSDKRPPELIDKVKDTAHIHKHRLKELKSTYLKLKSEYEELLSHVAITAHSRLFSGVACQVEKEKLNILQEHGPSKLQCMERSLQRFSL